MSHKSSSYKPGMIIWRIPCSHYQKTKIKHMKIVLITTLMLLIGVASKAQSDVAARISEKIAQRMKDSLSLSEQQKDSIYSLNILLSNRKAEFRKQYTDIDSLQIHFQRVERLRDSLYKTILGDEKYLLYKTKKRYLISNN
jgi:hypothetical protein